MMWPVVCYLKLVAASWSRMRAECSGEQLSAQKAFGSRDAWSSLRSEQFEMKATVMYAAGDVRVEHVPDPRLIEPTDAIVRITLACTAAAICGRTKR